MTYSFMFVLSNFVFVIRISKKKTLIFFSKQSDVYIQQNRINFKVKRWHALCMLKQYRWIICIHYVQRARLYILDCPRQILVLIYQYNHVWQTLCYDKREYMYRTCNFHVQNFCSLNAIIYLHLPIASLICGGGLVVKQYRDMQWNA